MKIFICTYATEKYKITYSPFPEANDGYDHLRRAVKVNPMILNSAKDILSFIRNGRRNKIENFKIIRFKPKSLIKSLDGKNQTYCVPNLAEITWTENGDKFFLSLSLAKI